MFMLRSEGEGGGGRCVSDPGLESYCVPGGNGREWVEDK